MNKVQLAITFTIIAIFIGIIIATQSGTITKNITQVPTLPPDASTFKIITPSAGQGQQAGQQGQQNGAAPTYGVADAMKASYSATIKTSKGNIQVSLNAAQAPRTVQNFILKANGNYYNGLLFHRVEDWVVQGGDPLGNGTGGGLMQTEINQLPFTTGSLGVARGSDIRVSNDSQFFITKSDATHLNGQYTNFGQVTDGMDVVNKIQIGDKILGITVTR